MRPGISIALKPTDRAAINRYLDEANPDPKPFI
jgi:hypothetical protein